MKFLNEYEKGLKTKFLKKQFLIIGMLILFVFVSGCGGNTTGNVVVDKQTSDDYLKIPLSTLSNQVKFYEFNDGGIIIKYFAVLGSDGLPRTAFDACDVCGGYKGYEQVGDDIKCRNCGKVFSIDGLGNQNKGYGCWPSYLPHKTEGDKILIKIDDIKAGRKRFI